jgi:hypothetical protein
VSWLDLIDRELVALREKEAHLHYEADLTGELDAAGLESVAKAKQRLLAGPDVAAEAERLAEHSDNALERRKAQLLGLTILSSRVDGDPELLACHHEVEDTQRHSKDQVKTPERALALFDFSQNLVDLWQRSNWDEKREILDCVSLNRTVSDVSLYVAKRRPFDFIAERACLKNGRGDWI